MPMKLCPYCLQEKEAVEEFEFSLQTYIDTGTQQCNYCEYVFGEDDDEVEYDESLQLYIDKKTIRDGADG